MRHREMRRELQKTAASCRQEEWYRDEGKKVVIRVA